MKILVAKAFLFSAHPRHHPGESAALKASRPVADPRPTEAPQFGGDVQKGWSQLQAFSTKPFSHEPLQQAPTVYYPGQKRCHTLFLARLTCDRVLNTFQSLQSQAGLGSAACMAKRSLPSSLPGRKGSQQGRFSLKLCKIVNHQQYLASTNLVGYPALWCYFFCMLFFYS